jgi:hypothetical protein
MTKYRIVIDNYDCFEAQEWRWWWPFWVMIGGVHTVGSVEAAERRIVLWASRGNVVKYVYPSD